MAAEQVPLDIVTPSESTKHVVLILYMSWYVFEVDVLQIPYSMTSLRRDSRHDNWRLVLGKQSFKQSRFVIICPEVPPPSDANSLQSK